MKAGGEAGKRGGKGGFTLVELLVVISIIALLMSILMPALGRVNKQAKGVVCQARLHQWALCFDLYANDNKGGFLYAPSINSWGWSWMEQMQPYYKDVRMRLCPLARKPYENLTANPGGVFNAWNSSITPGVPQLGSYGLNGWMTDAAGAGNVFGRPAKDNWGTMRIKNAYQVPVCLDAGMWDAWPLATDEPPALESERSTHGVLNSEIKRFCVNRHNGGTYGLFCDLSLRKVGLKELWTLKWHKTYNISGPWTLAGGATMNKWPQWMRKLKDY